MVYISYGVNQELFHSAPEEVAPLFGFEASEVTCCHLVIQTSHSFFFFFFSNLIFLKGTLTGFFFLIAANSTLKSQDFLKTVLILAINNPLGEHYGIEFITTM